MRSSAKESSALRSPGKVSHSLGVDEEGIVVVAMNEIKKDEEEKEERGKKKKSFFPSCLYPAFENIHFVTPRIMTLIH
jgi:hypothetical protein